jgi:rubrerythrin
MGNDQEKTVKALQISIQMEIDGKEFYLQTSQKSSNKMGEKLLHSLAEAEDVHRQKFIEIYDVIRSEKVWPKVTLEPDGAQNLKTVFALATEEMAPTSKPMAEELDALQTAMSMENKSLDFYEEQKAEAGDDTERNFYETVAAEERQHHIVLADYYEFLTDPAGWFVRKDHPSLDGG